MARLDNATGDVGVLLELATARGSQMTAVTAPSGEQFCFRPGRDGQEGSQGFAWARNYLGTPFPQSPLGKILVETLNYGPRPGTRSGTQRRWK